MPELWSPPGAEPALSEKVHIELWFREAATLLREKESADFKAMELELVEGIRTTQAAQVKLQQAPRMAFQHLGQDIVNAGGQVSARAQGSHVRRCLAEAVFLQRPSKVLLCLKGSAG